MNPLLRLLYLGSALFCLLILPACTREARAERKLEAANDHFQKSDYAAAEIEYKNVLEIEPGHPKALKGLGLIWTRQGNPLDAARILLNAKERLPEDDQVALNLARAFFELGFLGDSRQNLEQILDRNPANGEALMLYAETSPPQSPEALSACERRIEAANAPDQAPVLLASALIELRRGLVESGASTVKRVLEIEPDFPPALALQGTILRARKESEKAVEPMKRAAELGGPRSPELIGYSTLLMSLGRQEEAVDLLKSATEAAPDYVPSWRTLALISITGGNDAEASEQLAKALKIAPFDIESSLLQSQLWIRQNEPKKAVEMLDILTRTFPQRRIIELNLAKASLAAEEPARAAAALDRMIALNPEDAEALVMRARIHLGAEEAAEAARLMEELLGKSPTIREAQDTLVQAYNALGRADDAIAILTQQAAGATRDPGPQFRLGQMLMSQQRLAESRTAFEEVEKMAPDQFPAVGQLAILDLKEEQPDQAMARTDRYLAAHPDSAEAQLFKAELYYLSKDLKAAEAAAKRAIELNPDDLNAYNMVVRIQIEDGRSDEAIQQIEELLKTSPDNVPARMQLGILLQQAGRPDDARAAIEELLEISPDFAPALNNLAFLESSHPDLLDQALGNARKARSLAPRDPSIADTLGWIEWLRGNYTEALPLLQEAAGGLPDQPSVLFHLAMARYMMGHLDDAASGLESALAASGDFPEKADAEKNLAILRDGEQADLATLEQRVKDDPKNIVALLQLARGLTAADRAQEALATYESALAVNPDLEAAWVGQSRLYATRLDQPEKAVESATKAREVAPQSPRAAAALGSANLLTGNYDLAYSLLQEAAGKLPDDSTLQYEFARAAYLTGRVEDARTAMKTVAAAADPALEPGSAAFLALTDPGVADDAAAPALIESALAADPDDVAALMARAAISEKSGDSAVEIYRKVLELSPAFNPAKKALARAYLDDPTQWDEAEKLASDARERLRDDDELTSILARVNFRKGDFDYAAQLLNGVAANRTLTASELFALGISQARTGNPEEARNNLEQAVAAGLPEADATAATNAIAEIDSPAEEE